MERFPCRIPSPPAVLAAVLLATAPCTAVAQEAPRSDAAITGRVEIALRQNGFVEPYHIDVRTEEGVVTLEGQVRSQNQREQAVSVARSVEGVREVEDGLTVASHDPGRLPAVSEGIENAPLP